MHAPSASEEEIARERSPFRLSVKGDFKKRRSYTWPVIERLPLRLGRLGISQEELTMADPPGAQEIAQPSTISSDRLDAGAAAQSSREDLEAEDEEGGRLRRQVTFVVAAVQTDFPNFEGNVLATCQQQAALGPPIIQDSSGNRADVHPRRGKKEQEDIKKIFETRESSVGTFGARFWPRWCCIDCKTAFYIAIASLMISVGVTIIVVTSVEHWQGNEEKGSKYGLYEFCDGLLDRVSCCSCHRWLGLTIRAKIHQRSRLLLAYENAATNSFSVNTSK